MELPLSYTDLNTRRLIEKQHSCQSSPKCCRATAALKSRRATPPKSPPLPLPTPHLPKALDRVSLREWHSWCSFNEPTTLVFFIVVPSVSLPLRSPHPPTHRRADCAFPPQVVNLFSVSLSLSLLLLASFKRVFFGS